MHTPNMNPNPRELRQFGLVTGALFVVFFAGLVPLLVLWRTGDFPVWLWPWGIAVVLSAWGLLHPSSLIHVYRPWIRFSLVLGWCMTHLVLGLLFYAVFTPMGCLMRLAGQDPIPKRFTTEQASYRVPHPPRDTTHMEKPF